MDDDILMEQFEKVINDLAKKFKDPSMNDRATYSIAYPTTILPLDYVNGLRVGVTELNKDITYSYDSIGIGEGSIVMFIGKTGSGKTTIAEQIATSITSPFKYSHVLHEDVENGSTLSRIETVSGWGSRQMYKKYYLRQKGITSKSFYARIYEFCKLKQKLILSNPEQFTYFTGTFDIKGRPVYKPIPDVVILDSLALLAPEEMSDEEKITGNMTGSQTAKVNAQIFKRLSQPLKAANVILLVINHLNANINISMFDNKGAQINYLGINEAIPGSNTPLYISNNIFKSTPSTKLTKDKEFGIDGFMLKEKIIKSRTNKAGQEINLVYDQKYGIDRWLTCYQFLKDNGLVHGQGWYYLEGMPEFKFQQKGFKAKLEDNLVMRQGFMELVRFCGNEYLSGAKDDGTKDVTEDSDLDAALMESFTENDFNDFAIGQ